MENKLYKINNFFIASILLFLTANCVFAQNSKSYSEKTKTSRTISFPITGFETVSIKPVEIKAEWDTFLFGKNPSSTYCHELARIAAILSEVSYVDAEQGSNENELSCCYRALGVSDESIDYHYDVDYSDSVWKNDQTAFSIASQKIESAEGKKNLVYIVIRGTPLNANEWCSNTNLSDSTKHGEAVHEGFNRASRQIRLAFDSYIESKKIDTKDSFFLITGHSRGASVANILAASLIDDKNFTPAKIYTYTFASPNVTTYATASDAKYNGIWNIINAEDIVPTVPFSSENWNYRKYGQTLTIINSWNCDAIEYERTYLPAMNKYYSMFLNRDYTPFKTGPFIPVQVSRILGKVNRNVSDFYNGKIALHDKAQKIFNKVFPDPPKENAHGNSGLFGFIKNKIDDRTDGFAEYSLNAFVDMHAMEGYLSWMLALDEKTLFSTIESSQFIIRGNFNAAVIDSNKNIVALILDGQVKYKSIKRPIAAVQLLPNLLSIGFPGNQDFSIIIYKGSILPTTISMTLEHYESSGKIIKKTEKKYISPHFFLAYEIEAGAKSTSSEIHAEQIWGSDASRAASRYSLKENSFHRTQPEINIDTNANIGLGLHSGTQKFYMSILESQNVTKFGEAMEISPGLGTQQTLWGPILLNIEAYSKFFQIISSEENSDEGMFNVVPSLRLLLTLKPSRRFQFFAAGVFDFHISGLNNTAFDSYSEQFSPIHFSNSVEAYPSIQFGLKF